MLDTVDAEIVMMPHTIDCPHCGQGGFTIEDPENAVQFTRVILQDCIECNKPVRVTFQQLIDAGGFYEYRVWTVKDLTKSDKLYLAQSQKTKGEVVSMPLDLTEIAKEASELYWAEGKKREHLSHEDLMRTVVIKIMTKFNLSVNGTVK